jgi:hypothetical protein
MTDNSSFENGGLAQLARAPALHAGGHRFDSDILHDVEGQKSKVERVNRWTLDVRH